MDMEDFEKDAIKRTIIALVKEHKKNCNGECGLSMIYAKQALTKSGIELTSEEREIFY